MEGHLERSPYLSKHIPRGELVELLSKSLLYLEVESHWKGDAALTSNCKSGFSLLEPHVCSLEPQKKLAQLPAAPHISINVPEPKINGTIIEPNGKRKSSPVAIEGPTEKRAKRDQEDMDIDNSSECTVSSPYIMLVPISIIQR
jgi:transducin (beta)-like 1